MGDITPWVGMTGIRFGESRDALRDRLGEYQTFRRIPGTPLIDHFMEDGVMLSYDESDHLVLIECTEAFPSSV